MNYVDDGDYDGTFFHRSIPGFVVQGGGYLTNTPNGSIFTDGASLIPADPPVVNEFRNGPRFLDSRLSVICPHILRPDHAATGHITLPS
jgi:cyclophilin family peptidyl-prolyl cis-trans isomerase